MLKEIIKKFIPEPVINAYHYFLARTAAVFYGHPSEKMVIIGVTGTNGKSSTVNFIAQILENLGETVGYTSTAGFKVGRREWINYQKMTMLGRFQTQKILKQMVKAGCKFAIIETSSQGITQYRHIGINYDMAVFTNLTPEHIEAHGGFENYKKAKGALFEHTAKSKRKIINKKKIQKISVINADDSHAKYFLSFQTDKKIEYHPTGNFTEKNIIAAMAAVEALGFEQDKIKKSAKNIKPVPGRFEIIDQGQPFKVIVDYAYEPAALKAVYNVINGFDYNRLIHITGSAGGGRDIARRKIIGELAAKNDDIVIVTNEDPYDEDPMQIINDVANAAEKAGKSNEKNLFRILDRQEAIDKAVKIAEKNDIVLITGKGNEPVMAVKHGKKIPWDDREAVRKALKNEKYERE